MYPELDRRLIFSPTHQDLCLLAELVADFMGERFEKIPRGSGIKAFLARPNKFGWDVKRKLIWLGTHSYLFRNGFRNYVEDHGGKPEIPIIEDYICQQTTAWSGLGVIDILAAVLDISRKQRSTLRSWYERHVAYYRILSIKGDRLKTKNLINGKPYAVRTHEARLFTAGDIIMGALLPWKSEWYWSGSQLKYRDLSEEIILELRETFLRQAPQIAYRYCDRPAEKATDALRHRYQEFVQYHGDDLVRYPDGCSMAEDLKKHKRLPGSVPLSLPPELIEHENGVGIYFNPDEGEEIMTGFNDIVSSFEKKGIDCNEDEIEGIRAFIDSDSISPGFVRRLVQEYGHEAIESAFFIRGGHEQMHLDYLLRKHKGPYYRKRYPHIALVTPLTLAVSS